MTAVPAPHLVFHLGAGGAAGFGHLARTRAIALVARERGWRVSFVVETSTPDLLPQDDANALHLAASRREALHMRDGLTAGGAALVVCDLPDRTAPTSRTSGAPRVLLNGDPAHVAVADVTFLRGATRPGQCDTPNTYCGVAYEVVRPEIRARRPEHPWAKDTVRDILVSFGASDPGFQTEAFLADAGDLDGLTVMAGPSFGAARIALIESALAGRGRVVTDPDAFPDLLADTDCFVTVGGQSVLEALHLGRPVAAVRWGSLAADVAWLADAGLVVDLGPASGAATRLAARTTQPESLAGCALAGFTTIDGLGAQRCVDVLAAYMTARFTVGSAPPRG